MDEFYRLFTAFHLTDTDKQPFTNANLQKHWTMLFFGFTSCNSVCPLTMAELAKMYRILVKHRVTTLPQVFMISLDPQHDDLARLKQYVLAFDKHFKGATSTNETITAMTHELGIAYMNVKTPTKTIEHTGTILLFNPQGELNAFFTMPHHAAWLAADFLWIDQTYHL